VSAGDRISRAAKAASDRPADPSPFRRPTGRATYPHRLSVDLDPERYNWLRRAAWEKRVAANDLIRAALDLLANDPAALDAAAERQPQRPRARGRQTQQPN